ncbi:MAG: glycosyltransferase family 39 protein [Vicinamibacterales bacterium]
MTRARWVLVHILLGAALLRFMKASTEPLDALEAVEFIPAAMTLSLEHHPIRVAQHAAVPIYFIRMSAEIFGTSDLGFRMLSVIVGTLTILLLYAVAERWWGPLAGLTVAVLLAAERYHAEVSAMAIDLVFDLFFVALTIFCFSRFLHGSQTSDSVDRRSRWLYGAAVASGVGFLCKELTALLVPVLFLSLVFTGQSEWLRRRQSRIALSLFLLTIAPDLYSNLTADQDKRMEFYARQSDTVRQRGLALKDSYSENGLYMSYADHLSRFRSISFNSEPFYFYFGEWLDWAGIDHTNHFGEIPFVDPRVSLTLWVGVALALSRPKKDQAAVFLLTMFFVAFVPFTLVQLGRPHATFPTDSQALWYWVDRSMLPALLLTGASVSAVLGQLRPVRVVNLTRLV